jgi:hypothetical protein
MSLILMKQPIFKVLDSDKTAEILLELGWFMKIFKPPGKRDRGGIDELDTMMRPILSLSSQDLKKPM